MGDLANCATVGSGSNSGGKVCFECRMMGYMPEQEKIMTLHRYFPTFLPHYLLLK